MNLYVSLAGGKHGCNLTKPLLSIRPVPLLSPQAMRMQTEMELRMFKQNEYVYHSMRDAALKNKPMSMMHEPKCVEDEIKNLFHRRK